MNDTMQIAPEVAAFVAQVRARLADLTEEEREELVGGLAADLSERLADGEDDLGDPTAYAAELRSAAGLERTGPARVRVLSPRASVADLLDGSRRRWERLVATQPLVAQARDLLVAVQPAWWVLRGWLAVEVLDVVVGPTEFLTPVPSLGGQLVGGLLTLGAVVVSVLLGVHRLWPASHARSSRVARDALVLLNVCAVVAVPAVLARFADPWPSHALANGEIFSVTRQHYGPALRANGRYVRNVFAYDAAGEPLTGVQLFDQEGRPLGVTEDADLGSYRSGGQRVLTYPWLNGDQELFNVFPLPVRQQGPFRRVADPWAGTRPPALPDAPLAVVPSVSLPTPTGGADPQGAPQDQPQAEPSGEATGKPAAGADSEKRPPR